MAVPWTAIVCARSSTQENAEKRRPEMTARNTFREMRGAMVCEE